ncbi:hypothetical protein F4778DRAFT_737885 [Xylariomycetidae sp. FL2044]|nr:hypothetical protein F4778DRAFT_737885 [Xylariomycetidae sp. FL2044]
MNLLLLILVLILIMIRSVRPSKTRSRDVAAWSPRACMLVHLTHPFFFSFSFLPFFSSQLGSSSPCAVEKKKTKKIKAESPGRSPECFCCYLGRYLGMYVSNWRGCLEDSRQGTTLGLVARSPCHSRKFIFFFLSEQTRGRQAGCQTCVRAICVCM